MDIAHFTRRACLFQPRTKMTRGTQETLVILKPHKILQIISIFIEIWWIYTILRAVQPFFFKVDLYLPPGLLLFVLIFISSFFWIVLNTINTQILVRNDSITMRGVLWKTHISWETVKEIKLIYNQKNNSRAVEIYAKKKQLPFNNKVSFDSNFHRDVRRGVRYTLELAKEHDIPIKTDGWLCPSYYEWEAWANN